MSNVTTEATLIRKRHERYLNEAQKLYEELVDDFSVPHEAHTKAMLCAASLEQWFATEYPGSPATTAAPAPEFDKIHGAAVKAAPLLPGTYNDSTGLGDGDSFVRIEQPIQDDRNGFEGGSML
jgi:hypothetical protein